MYEKTFSELPKLTSGSLKTKTFDEGYLQLVKQMTSEGALQKSRNGDTLEILNFKTEILNPKYRCVGGYGRNMNIFFLLYEAIWIWLGEKRVEPLTIFNSNMKNFSDDGEVFHAPYGFRLRNYGVPSDRALFVEQCKTQGMPLRSACLPPEGFIGLDQFAVALTQLSKNEEDRRVVMNIWNPILDSGFSCKDLPCNDMVMLKIRENKLHMTIQNRSNDLHWGLPTNVFQFSFILECMALILNKELGTQTHNSQSLHVYLSNPTTLTMLANESKGSNLYFGVSMNDSDGVDFDFQETDVLERYYELDTEIRNLNTIVLDYYHGVPTTEVGLKSSYFRGVAALLKVYIDFKKSSEIDKDVARLKAIEGIIRIEELRHQLDLKILAINFFVQRITDKDKVKQYKQYNF